MRAWFFLSLAGVVGACVGDSNTQNDAGPDATTNDTGADVQQDSSVDGGGSIHGFVVNLIGEPVMNTKVDVGGTVVMTDTSGKFTAADPGPTYDVALGYHAAGTPQEEYSVYRGLTRRDPTILLPLDGFLSTVDVSGDAGAAAVTSALVAAHLVYVPKTVRGGQASTTVGAGGYASTAVPFYSVSQTGTLYMYEQASNDAGVTTGYPWFASLPNVAFANNGTYTENFGAQTTITTGTITGSVMTPATGTWTISNVNLYGMFGPWSNLQLDSISGAPTFSFVAPSVTGLGMLVYAGATSGLGVSNGWKANLASNATNVTITLPQPATFTAPLTGSTVLLSSTPFAFSNTAGGVVLMNFTCNPADAGTTSATANYIARVITTASSVQAPTDAALSLALPPSGSKCAVTIRSMPSFTTMDSAAGAGGYTSSFSWVEAATDGAIADSLTDTVTVQ